jgi:hypothetical protein
MQSENLSLSLLIFLLGITSCQEIPDATVGDVSYYQIHFAQTFNKFGTINNPFSDKGFGQISYLGVNHGIERFGKFEFYLVPQIQI